MMSLTAQADITLRLADSLPSGHIIHQVITAPFIEAVKKETGGQVRIEHFPGEQVGKARDMLSLTQAGVIDIGYVVPAYASDKMPLSAGIELPGIFTDYCQGMAALYTLTHDGGYLETSEFAANKVIPLVTFLLPPYQIVLGTDRKIASLKDLSGLKIRSAGGPMDFMIKGLGMIPVRMAPPEIYESLSRGTIDGALLPYMSVESYGITGLLKSGTSQINFGTVALTYSIGAEKWKKLPEPVRTALTKVSADISKSACKSFEAVEGKLYAKLDNEGSRAIGFGPADQKEIAAIFDRAGSDWAASLDQRGKAGSAALAAVKQAVAGSR
ncbi:TRAP transporter substrate-binding protein DctP [Azospirillum sp. TSO35-2]|uniref:TRAP transporter substrate-binding protein n=1 Tax=Azospirillum sp. TSO35-2 TaxID=716796 RepID=UPI001304AD9F|nr:TRAP transporter substrate-binding protein DctP [Azospirillum sp. TSO35-2]